MLNSGIGRAITIRIVSSNKQQHKDCCKPNSLWLNGGGISEIAPWRKPVNPDQKGNFAQQPVVAKSHGVPQKLPGFLK
jgi:hypothetical protein